MAVIWLENGQKKIISFLVPRRTLYYIYSRNPIKAIYRSVEVSVLEGLKPYSWEITLDNLCIFNGNNRSIIFLNASYRNIRISKNGIAIFYVSYVHTCKAIFEHYSYQYLKVLNVFEAHAIKALQLSRFVFRVNQHNVQWCVDFKTHYHWRSYQKVKVG